MAELEQFKEDWRRVIYDATGDNQKALRAIELAELNGLFDPVKAAPDMLAAARLAVDALMNADPGNPKNETGWAHDESLRCLDCSYRRHRQSRAPPMTAHRPDWQPIASAPKDGTRIDVWCLRAAGSQIGVRFTDVCWRGDDSGWGFLQHDKINGAVWHYLEREGDVFPAWSPTHWCEPPSPPHADEDRR